MASLSSYYTFYLMHKFGVSVQQSQIFLFVFLLATAAGTLMGGPIGDRIGRKYVIWMSILGTAPFSILMPHVSLAWSGRAELLCRGSCSRQLSRRSCSMPKSCCLTSWD